MATKKIINSQPIFYCEMCDYKCSVKQRFQVHCESIKHLRNTSNKKNNNNTIYSKTQKIQHDYDHEYNDINIIDQYEKKIGNTSNKKNNVQLSCCCGNIYESRSGLWRHKKTCKIVEKSTNTEHLNSSELMKFMIQNNTEMYNLVKEVIKTISNTSQTHNHNTNSNNTNSHNTFNLQFYLNETCKNAMNLSEFIENIKPTMKELEITGREGYVKGISNIILSRLGDVDMTEKPIQCSDAKREVLYIKENDIWNKEAEEKPLLTNAIKKVTHRNLCNISEWQKLHPDCTDSESRKNDLYLKIVSNSISGGTKEESNENYDKIISSVAKNTVIQKL
jgi:hypothetical protein